MPQTVRPHRRPRPSAWCLAGCELAALAALALAGSPLVAAPIDRTTLLLPLALGAAPGERPSGVLADEAFGPDAGDGWQAYMRVWESHHGQPSSTAIRRFLGLSQREAFECTARRGRTAPRWLAWPAGSYAQIDTAHFVIYSRADQAASLQVAEDLERCYWVWTQLFFPLWEASPQVTAALQGLSPQGSVEDFLRDHPGRITLRRKLRVVLFRDAAEYQRTLALAHPGIERSTGYYDNEQQTTYLYVTPPQDGATRHHELVHQLFREATRSGLGGEMPAQTQGFWLIEGIAGYFESLWFGERIATVGGWDSPRLQFARYRILAGGDVMPFDQLQADGWQAAQQREDIARWYAHAILQTHHLLDGSSTAARRWVYGQLARRYKIPSELAEQDDPLVGDQVDRGTRAFLTVDDARLAARPIDRQLGELVLAECRVTASGLQLVPPAAELRWLDLTRLPIGNDAVERLGPRPQSLQQLRLEATQVDAGLVAWLRGATNLQELDLSWTAVDDSIVQAVAGAEKLSILYLTGTRVSDQSIDTLAGMLRLQTVDLQRTAVTAGGLARLRAARPDLELNTIQLLPQPPP